MLMTTNISGASSEQSIYAAAIITIATTAVVPDSTGNHPQATQSSYIVAIYDLWNQSSPQG